MQNTKRQLMCFGCPGFYMMANTGADILSSGGTTRLSSPVHQGAVRTECVHFWYHMGGENPGEMLSNTHAHMKMKTTEEKES